MVSEFLPLFAEQSNRVGGVSAEQKIGFFNVATFGEPTRIRFGHALSNCQFGGV